MNLFYCNHRLISSSVITNVTNLDSDLDILLGVPFKEDTFIVLKVCGLYRKNKYNCHINKENASLYRFNIKLKVISHSAHLDCSRDRLFFHPMHLLGLSLRLNLHLVFNFMCTPESAGEHWLVDGSVRYIKFYCYCYCYFIFRQSP